MRRYFARARLALETRPLVRALAGSLGALMAGGPAVFQDALGISPTSQRLFFVFVPVGLLGALIARSLSSRVEPA